MGDPASVAGSQACEGPLMYFCKRIILHQESGRRSMLCLYKYPLVHMI